MSEIHKTNAILTLFQNINTDKITHFFKYTLLFIDRLLSYFGVNRHIWRSHLPLVLFSENACTIWQLYIRLMCSNFWFCHLIRDFSFWIFLGLQYFCDFTFYYHNCTWSKKNLEQWYRGVFNAMILISK